MSLKENVNYIKEEIGQEEKMLEGLIRFEGWFRRYKTPLLGALTLLLAAWIGSAGYAWYQENRAQKASAIYEKLLKDPSQDALKAELAALSPELHELFLFQQASQKGEKAALEALKDSKNPIIASMVAYQLASLAGEASSLASYTAKEGVLFGDLARVSEAYLLFKEGKNAEAKGALEKVALDSPIKGIARFLEHYGVKEGEK